MLSIWLSSRSDAKLDWRAEDVPVVVALTEISTVGVVVVPPGAGSDGAAPDPDDVATFDEEDEEEDEEEEAEDDEEEEEDEEELPESPAIAFITFRFIKWPALAVGVSTKLSAIMSAKGYKPQ